MVGKRDPQQQRGVRLADLESFNGDVVIATGENFLDGARDLLLGELDIRHFIFKVHLVETAPSADEVPESLGVELIGDLIASRQFLAVRERVFNGNADENRRSRRKEGFQPIEHGGLFSRMRWEMVERALIMALPKRKVHLFCPLRISTFLFSPTQSYFTRSRQVN